MASTVRTRLNHVQSEPPPPNISLFNMMETIPSASTERGILSGTQSLHTTPRDNGSSDGHSLNVEVEPDSVSNGHAHRPVSSERVSSINGLRISVAIPSTENQRPSHSQSARHSSRSSQRRQKEQNSSRQAGHTPPPSAQSKAANFNLVQDTDKKEGPINWWNLRVKMPDDNTMHILSPHRIPVPRTPTTPSSDALSFSFPLSLSLIPALN